MSAVGSVSAFGFVTALLAPEAPGTKALGTNGSSIVGEFTDNTGTQGFIDSGGNVIVLDVPGASSTEVLGINSMGDGCRSVCRRNGNDRLRWCGWDPYDARRPGRVLYRAGQHQQHRGDRRIFCRSDRNARLC